MIIHNKIIINRQIKISTLALLIFLQVGCDIKSSERSTQSTFIDADIAIDGHEDTLNLIIYLSAPSPGEVVSLPVLLTGGDRLALSIDGVDYPLEKNSGDSRYSVAINPIPVSDDIRLLYVRQSRDEILESPVNYRFSISDLSVEKLDMENINISWSIASSNSSPDQSVLSERFNFSAKPLTCHKDDGHKVTMDTDSRLSFLVLDSTEFSVGNVEVQPNQISKRHRYLFDDHGYTACEYEIVIVSRWRNHWDGENEPTGNSGPIWIWPSKIFNNEQQSLRYRGVFGIEVSSNLSSIEIRF